MPRRSRDHGAPRMVHPTSWCVSSVAAYNVTDAKNYTQTAHIPHGSAETYPIAPTVGGRRPRRPFLWITDDVSLLLTATPRAVGRTVPGAPPSVDGRRCIPCTNLPPRTLPASLDGQRYYAAPTLHQPLSHGPVGRDSSPFMGAEGWAEVCGVCASVYRDADSYVSLTPVGGGDLDAPRSWVCRGGVVADGRRGRLRRRFPRCARLASTTQRIQSRGHSPRTIGATRRTHVVRHPAQGASRTPPPTVGARHTLLRVG